MGACQVCGYQPLRKHRDTLETQSNIVPLGGNSYGPVTTRAKEILLLDILLVEQPDSRGVLEEQLTEAGHRVQTSPDGRTGAEHIKERLFD